MVKIIHYCWFGQNPLSDLAIKCIKSWKKYCPTYEIKEWNESNFDVNCCSYVSEAYKAKKWAFVSDYVRFKILYEFGGLYFDTDVELIKPIDSIIAMGPFMGCEKSVNQVIQVAPGLGLAVEPHHPFYKEILDDYEHSHFTNADGTSSYLTVVIRTTNTLKRHGLKDINTIQTINGINIYPCDFFCPLDYNTNELKITDNTISIHWYDASWFDLSMTKRRNNCVKIRKIFKGNAGEKVCMYYMKVSYFWEWIRTGKIAIVTKKLKRRLFL